MAGVVWRGFRRQHPLAGNQGNSRILQDAPGFLMMLKVGTRPSPPWCWSQRLGRTVDPAGSSLSINAICCRVGILDGFFESLNHSIQPISFPPPPPPSCWKMRWVVEKDRWILEAVEDPSFNSAASIRRCIVHQLEIRRHT